MLWIALPALVEGRAVDPGWARAIQTCFGFQGAVPLRRTAWNTTGSTLAPAASPECGGMLGMATAHRARRELLPPNEPVDEEGELQNE